MIAAGTARLVQIGDRLGQLVEGFLVTDLTRHEPDAFGELLPDLFSERGSRMLFDCGVHDLGEVLVRPVSTGEPDQREARWQQTAVGQVVDRRHQLLG